MSMLWLSNKKVMSRARQYSCTTQSLLHQRRVRNRTVTIIDAAVVKPLPRDVADCASLLSEADFASAPLGGIFENSSRPQHLRYSTEPHNNVGRTRVYLVHHLDLSGSFFKIRLVDADSIDPIFLARCSSLLKAAQCVVKVLLYLHRSIVATQSATINRICLSLRTHLPIEVRVKPIRVITRPKEVINQSNMLL